MARARGFNIGGSFFSSLRRADSGQSALLFLTLQELIINLIRFIAMTNIIKSWNGRTIRFREEDQYGSLTDMAQATNKRVNDWLRLNSTTEYLTALEGSAGIPADQLIQVNESTGSNEERGTWAHRRVCIRFAQWCSPEFAVQVDAWVEELLTTGGVSIKPISQAQAIIQGLQLWEEMQQEQRRIAIEAAVAKAIAEKAEAVALEAKDGLAQVRDQLASLKEFAVAQPPGLDQDQADLINQAFQMLGATLESAGIYQRPECYKRPWTELGLTMRNSAANYDLNARYSNALKQYETDLTDWEANGKLRGQKPNKPSRISVLVRDSRLGEGFRAAQQVVSNYLNKIK